MAAGRALLVPRRGRSVFFGKLHVLLVIAAWEDEEAGRCALPLLERKNPNF
jgi:hypothetical protein